MTWFDAIDEMLNPFPGTSNKKWDELVVRRCSESRRCQEGVIEIHSSKVHEVVDVIDSIAALGIHRRNQQWVFHR